MQSESAQKETECCVKFDNLLSSAKKKPKTAAQRQKEYRQRLKDKIKNEASDTLQQANSLRCKAYRDKIKLQRQRSQLLEVLSNKEATTSQIQINKEIDNVQDQTQEKEAIATGDAMLLNNSQRLRDNSQDNLLMAQYEQREACAMPNYILYHFTDILGDGNCFFASVIKILQLAISPKDLRKQLLQSVYLNACLDSSAARSILSSDCEYAESHCIFIFSREYNQNVCVHIHYIDVNTNEEKILFSHFKVNNSQKFIHLHLRDQHFTPYIETQQTNLDKKIDNQQIKDLLFETSSDVDIDDSLYKSCLSNNAKVYNDNVLKLAGDTIIIYTNYYKHANGHLDFHNDFRKNTFGHSCAVCDRVWWKNDLKLTSDKHDDILKIIIPNYKCGTAVNVCSTCKKSLDRQKIPLLSVYNGFSYPIIPPYLPTLNIIEERLISPRIPFVQIRRLRHVNGQCDVYGQIINVPVEVNTMVNQLPRNIDDDHCFYVHLKNKIIHNTSFVHGLINKKNIKEWLKYLVKTPLYLHYGINIDNTFFNNDETDTTLIMDDVSEHVPKDDYVTAQQQTLMWKEDKFLHMVTGKKSVPLSLLFDKYVEELSFPTIYGGQLRTYRDEIHATSFLQATSEIRRTDRRGIDPQHLFYMAVKIMRQRISESVSVAFKYNTQDTKVTKEDIQTKNYINNCIETNLAFLRCIPNSAWYWSDRKKDLLAMIRQLGTPTAFMILSANESGWEDLLKILYKLKHNGADVSDKLISQMNYVHKAKLINEDAVTCVIYFKKLVDCLLKILQSKKRSPFGKYRVVHYFKSIEFQNCGSPHAHVLLWLDNAPKDLLNNNKDVIQMIDELVSVSESEASGNIKLLTHQHNFTCYRNMKPNKNNDCRFAAPFMPTKNTITLIPIKDTDSDYSNEIFKNYKEHYKLIRSNLENVDYIDFDHFYTHNNIENDEHYYKIIRAGIKRPKLFYRRKPSEKWHHSFNPFVFHHLKSNMNFQIISDEYACATYVVEYVNKHNRGISNLQRQLIQTMDENPEFDIVEITKKMSVDLLNSVEMSAQEAAWYLLRESLTKSSIVTVYIPTIYPSERQRIRKTMKEINELNDDCADVLKENWFDKYEKRPGDMNDVTLAQFVAYYYINNKGVYTKRDTANVIRYRNYDLVDNFNDYRREMVLLHIPFRSEDNDILAENKYIQIYDGNKDLILQRRKEFESNIDIDKTIRICRELSTEIEEGDCGESITPTNFIYEIDPYEVMQCDTHSDF